MSTTVGTLKKTGSRNVDMDITRYWGGKEKGVCMQLTARQEEGQDGYIQLSLPDFLTLAQIFVTYFNDELLTHLIDFSEGEKE